ncbi:MAG: septum formation initiator [Lachnospiraceae bacterium]|nr:septum formation initiator [Lachnospiraceae bacterium]
MKKGIVPKKHMLAKRALSILILLVLVGGIGAASVIALHGAQDDYQKKLEEKERLIRLKAQEEARSEEIEQYRAYVKTRGYMEEVAREVLGLVYKDEILFHAEEGDGVTPSVTPEGD